MKQFDAKSRYALLAALDLAAHYGQGGPAKVQEIAARTGAPAQYLVQILLLLKRAALVASKRGARGGYWLTRPPEMISAAQVLSAVRAGRGRRSGPPPRNGHERALGSLWQKAERSRHELLAQTSLAELLAAGGDD